MKRLIAVPEKGSPEEDALVRGYILNVIEQKFAEDVIHGRVIHNVETGEFCLAEVADEDFKADAVIAYRRFLEERR